MKAIHIWNSIKTTLGSHPINDFKKIKTKTLKRAMNIEFPTRVGFPANENFPEKNAKVSFVFRKLFR